MDVVLIMEELSDHLAQLRAVFGWQMDLDRGVWRSHWHQIPRNVLGTNMRVGLTTFISSNNEESHY